MADDLEIPFIFVPHGAPEPTEWMALHPGWVKFPATFVPHAMANRPTPADPSGWEHAIARRPAMDADPDALVTDIAATDMLGSLTLGVAVLLGAYWAGRSDLHASTRPRPSMSRIGSLPDHIGSPYG
ncbi:MAG: hypothetical protein ABS99_09540 [Acetobacteraceae bacterium SCN 69-10]|nr:hypothetical protein [Rhodospirillales bacterium]ODU54349.1 MAG: hypothetical protein ABS99_09540 [Acetobacteraceae bacterium SCN 69-10]